MPERDPLDGLHEMADFAATNAAPLPPGEVRRRGTRRRQRRHAAVAGVTAVVVLLGGSAVASQIGLDGALPKPPIANTPTPSAASASPSPARTVTAENLIAPTDLPEPQGGGRIEEYDPSAAGHSQIPSCRDAELDQLGATSWLRRNLAEVYDYGPGETPDPNAPGAGLPTMCVVAWQFDSTARAESAWLAYQEQITERRNSATYLDYTIRETLGFDWSGLDVPGAAVTVAEVVYSTPGSDDAFWESHGLTRVDDRLMLTVYRHVGIDWNVALDKDAGRAGLQVHPQIHLTEAAAARLADARPSTEPSPTPGSPRRVLTEAHLITIDQVPPSGDYDVLIADPDEGRPVSEASACVPRGKWGSLGATQVLTRNFRWNYEPVGSTPPADPGHPEYNPLYNLPRLYTAALQFADEAAAKQAQARYRDWLSTCAAELKRRGYARGIQVSKTRWIDVPVQPTGGRTVGEFATLPTYLPAGTEVVGDGSRPLYWEHVGLTRVEDRLMITVEVDWAIEYEFSEKPGGEPDVGWPPNYQFALVRAAADRLTG